MTHAEALAISLRALDARPDCHHQLVRAPHEDRHLSQTKCWVCTMCDVFLFIDHAGVIRDTIPIRETRP
jgi:hypothetical protein